MRSQGGLLLEDLMKI